MKFKFEYELMVMFDSPRHWAIGSWSYHNIYGGQYGWRLLGVSLIVNYKK